MDREAWRAVIHGITKSRTRLSDLTELNWIIHILTCSMWDSQFTNTKPFIWGYSLYHNLNFGPNAIFSPTEMALDTHLWSVMMDKCIMVAGKDPQTIYFNTFIRRIEGLRDLPQGYPALWVCVFKILFLDILFQSFISSLLCGSQRPFPEVDSQEDSGNS